MRTIIICLLCLYCTVVNVSCWHVNQNSNQSHTKTKVSQSTSVLKKHELYFNKGLKVLRKEFVNQRYPSKKIERSISKYKRMFIQTKQVLELSAQNQRKSTDVGALLNEIENIDKLVQNKRNITREPEFQMMKMNSSLLIDNNDFPDITLMNLEETLFSFFIIYKFILRLGVIAE